MLRTHYLSLVPLSPWGKNQQWSRSCSSSWPLRPPLLAALQLLTHLSLSLSLSPSLCDVDERCSVRLTTKSERILLYSPTRGSFCLSHLHRGFNVCWLTLCLHTVISTHDTHKLHWTSCYAWTGQVMLIGQTWHRVMEWTYQLRAGPHSLQEALWQMLLVVNVFLHEYAGGA